MQTNLNCLYSLVAVLLHRASGRYRSLKMDSTKCCKCLLKIFEEFGNLSYKLRVVIIYLRILTL